MPGILSSQNNIAIATVLPNFATFRWDLMKRVGNEHLAADTDEEDDHLDDDVGEEIGFGMAPDLGGADAECARKGGAHILHEHLSKIDEQ